MRILFALCFVFGVVSPVAVQLPDAVRTPGAVNPAITQANILQNICNPKWSTKSIRPPASYTTALKKKQMQALGLTVPNNEVQRGRAFNASQCVEKSGNPACYEEDHLISLELGGDPRSEQNLWPEPYAGDWGAKKKDTLENWLHKQVCAGSMTLQDAQHAIATDWVATYQKVGLK